MREADRPGGLTIEDIARLANVSSRPSDGERPGDLPP
jgi:hypothetical protein